MDCDDLLFAALKLPRAERARLAHAIIMSLDESTPDGEEGWSAELRRRVQEVESGAVELEEWAMVRDRVRRKLAGRNA